MLLKDYLQELGDRLGVQNIDDAKTRAILTRKLNEGLKEVGRVHDWDHLKINGSFNTVSNYTTGTADIVNGSQIINGTGTWTAQMVGRFFNPSGSSNWYKIIRFISSTSLILETQIVEASATVSYVIWKRFYYLPSNIRKVKIFGKWIDSFRIEETSENKLIDRGVNQSVTGTPCEAIDSGVDPFESAYAVGTVNLTLNDNVLTGNGTAWFGNIEPGDRITIGGRVFRVKRVESDTRIVMWNYADSTSSNANYTIEKDNPIGFQLYPSPDIAYVIPYIGYARVFDMVNENKDRPPFPEDFDGAILDAAEVSRMRDLDDAKWIQKQLELKGRIIDLKAMMSQSRPRTRQMVPDIHTRRPN